VYGEGWRDEWVGRIEGTEPWLLHWLEEQVDGPYWRHGSLRPGYERIVCPTMIVAGWADGYRNNTFRTFEALRCPKRLLVGPWSHMSQATSLPGPHIDLVPELIRWFGRWLRDERNGVDEEPPVVVFARRSTRPAPDLAEMRGEWRAESTWPPVRLDETVLRPTGDGIDEIHVRGDVGRTAWISCAGKLPWGQPDDQRPDDALSLVYDWEPLAAELDVMGHPRLRLSVTAEAPVVFVSAKLCDVFADGTSALVTRGILNLAHRGGHATPAQLEPGVPTPVEIELEATSWIFEPGHRVRLTLAGADWPNVWPPPAGGTLLVDRGSVELRLPVLDGPGDLPPPSLPLSRGTDPHATEPEGDQPPLVWRFEHDLVAKETRAITSYGWRYQSEFGAQVDERYDGAVGVSTEDPSRAWAQGTSVYRIAWPEAEVRTEARLDLRSDAKAYHVVIDVVAEELGSEIDSAGIRYERRFERKIPRRLQ
jgi:predicted acyl esterase